MRRWFLVCLLSVGLSIAYTHRSNIAYAIASPEFVAQLHLTDTDRGLLGSAFFWTYGLLQIPAGSLVDRFGPKWPLAAGFLLWCLVSASHGIASGFAALLGCRLLLGLFEAVVTPAGLRWVRDHAEESRRGTLTGVFFSGSKYGPAIGAPVGAWLIKQYGWRTMFIDQGLFGLLWLIPWILFAKSGRPKATTPSRQSKAPEAPFVEVFRSKLMWGTLIGTFSYNYFVFYALTWLPAYFVEQRHLSLTSSGFYSGFSYGGMAAMAILGGFAADWRIERGAGALEARRGFTIVGLLIASTVVLGALAATTAQAVFFSVLSMTGLGLATANYWALPQTAMPKSMAGRVAGAQNMALTVAGTLAPLATGWLKQISGGYGAPMAATSVILMIGVAAYVFLVRPPSAVAAELSSGLA
jgi:MFS transporter, ACS family, D-galactonate transporter